MNWIAASIIGIGFTVVAQAAPFQNLDFESAIPPFLDVDPGIWDRASISNTLPGWSGQVAGEPVLYTLYNNFFLSCAGISLFGPNHTNFTDGVILEGNYTAFLQSGYDCMSSVVPTSLSQTGDVPADARSIRLRANPPPTEPYPRLWTITLGGAPVALVPLDAGPNYTIYGGDVSGFAGQTVALEITSLANQAPWPDDRIFLWVDSIGFSPTPVPEPGSLALLALGLCVLACRHRLRAHPSRVKRPSGP